MNPPPTYDRVAELLRTRDRFLLTGHVRADGDCLGAESALFHLVRALGKSAVIVNPDPINERYAFLAAETPFDHWRAEKPDGGVGPFDVACVLDVAVLSRTGPLAELITRRGATRVTFDHHVPDGTTQWDEKLIDSTASSSGALVLRLAKRMGVQLPKPALEAVFVSIATDTGWFRYSNSDRETFQVAADLVEAGIDPAVIYGKLFQTMPPEWPIGVGVALRGLRYEADGRLAVAGIRQDDLRRFGGELTDTDEVLDVLRAVERVDVVLLFREVAPGRVKCSARSKGGFDVNVLLKGFGGGGHMRAAGADLAGTFDESVDRVVKAAVAAMGPGKP